MEKEILNGCGGKKGSKCYVEEYIMPYGQVQTKKTPKRKADKAIGQKAAGN